MRRSRARGVSALSLAVLAVGVAVLLTAIATGSNAGGSGRSRVAVTERDFHIMAPRRLQSGLVTLHVTNRGPDTHELIVVRAADSRLPLRADGLTVDEDRLERAKAGSVEGSRPGSEHDLRLHLRPGRYEVFCNMSGHYLGGMHAAVIVR